MHFLSGENLSKSYSEKLLLDKVSLGINEGDKIGLIGVNGSGKTTLLRILAGTEQADEGEIIKGSQVRMAYLPQEPAWDPEAGVLEQVFKGNPVMDLVREYNEAAADPDMDGEVLSRLVREMDSRDAWSLESEARAILTKLGIEDYSAKMDTLSGGQKKRVALAAVLVQPAQLLLLDEPTNHLDDTAIEWLEQRLSKRKGALLMVTHDRYFLDRVANQILELDRGTLYPYKGNYSYFLEKKLEREEAENVRERKRQRLFKAELAWIRSGAPARTTKQKARIERFHRLQEQKTDTPQEKLQISVAGSRLGKKVIRLDHVGKAFEGVDYIDDFSLELARDARIGIVGPNGAGKTTLLNILRGSILPDSGLVEVGETVKIGLYSQELQQPEGSMKVMDYIKEDAGYLCTAEGESISASQMLERFLFPPVLQWSLIQRLSGGEKRRLNLLKVLMQGPNVLLLDEPTNDLDVETLTVLEDYLDHFEGAVVAVSHDRFFLDRVAARILAFEGRGRIKSYPGNYTAFRKKKELDASTCNLSENKKGAGRKAAPDKKAPVPGEEKKPLKLTYREQKEYEQIEGVIADLEEKAAGKKAEVNQAGADHVLLQRLCAELAELEGQLNEKMERWVYLNELAERMKRS